MTSMFDQYEQASLHSKNNNVRNAEISTLGYINMSGAQEIPIFTRTKKDFTPSDKITHVSISNKYMVVALANSTIFRMCLNNPQKQEVISISKYTENSKLTNLFLDPHGNHLLLTFAPKKPEGYPELLYLSSKSNKLRAATSKFRTQEFSEVAWNYANDSDSTTGPILLGTTKGLILETEIFMEGEKFFTSGFEQYWKWKQVFDIGKGSNIPITGLEFFRVPATDKYVIFAATPFRLYHFIGHSDADEKPLLQQVFNRYLNIPEEDTYINMNCESNSKYSRLKFWSENLTTPNSFAWATEKGILYSQIDLRTDDKISDIEKKCKIIQYPKPLYEDYSVSLKYPLGIALTEFHILLAYTDTIKGMCLLNREVVYEDNYNEAFGKLVNIVKDESTGDIWAVTENAIFRFKITKEERNVWQIFCENNQFELAKKYSRGDEASYNLVLTKEAEMLFNEKKYDLSAQCYAETRSSFEEICLKFIQIDQQDSLKIFLRRKLETLETKEAMQITMIVIWLVEIYLSKLEEKRLRDMEQGAAYSELEREFESFLASSKVSACIKRNKSMFYDLMASHGDKTNLIKMTIVNKDYEQLIRHHIYKSCFREALEELKSQQNYELYYQFAPILMQEVPKFMVKALIDRGRKLVPLKLLPALVSCEGETHAREVMKYLEFCIEKLKNTDRAIHNFLLSLYAKYDSEKLLEYLNNQGEDMVNYDIHFALRLCQEKDLTEACVKLSCLLGLWESAVDLSLKISKDSAKQVVNMSPENNTELRKKLWLKIAQHVVNDENDIKKAMLFLQDCDLIRIEDILPFFPDFATIDHFKDAICNSLKEYNQHIQDLKDEMEEATKSADQVRQEIQSFRNRYTFIRSASLCDICNVNLIIRQFYIFPCQHKFHSDCLQNELSPFLGAAKRNKLADLERQMKVLNNQINIDNISTGSTGMTAKEMVKAEIDNIIASECLYCGENMIRNIDKPFIEDCDYERILKEWQ